MSLNIKRDLNNSIDKLLTEKLLPYFTLFPKPLLAWFGYVLHRFITGLSRAQYYRELLTNQNISDVNFKLWVAGKHPSGQRTYLESQNTKEAYELMMVESLRNALRIIQKPVFMDIGAFMGYYACYVNAYLKDSLPVYAVESNPDYCKVIRKSVKENNFKNLKVFDAVLSDKEEVLSVYKETVSKDNAEGRKIKTITLDELCAINGISPDVLKIDVHGAEGKVFFGAKNILKNHAKFIFFELHPDDYLDKYSPGITREAVLKLIQDSGFKCYLIGGFRYKRSPERDFFNKTGKISCIQISPQNRGMLFFDRHVDLFIFAMKGYGLPEMDVLTEKYDFS